MLHAKYINKYYIGCHNFCHYLCAALIFDDPRYCSIYMKNIAYHEIFVVYMQRNVYILPRCDFYTPMYKHLRTVPNTTVDIKAAVRRVIGVNKNCRTRKK